MDETKKLQLLDKAAEGLAMLAVNHAAGDVMPPAEVKQVALLTRLMCVVLEKNGVKAGDLLILAREKTQAMIAQAKEMGSEGHCNEPDCPNCNPAPRA